MATADRRWRLLVALPVVAAAVLGVVALRSGSSRDGEPAGPPARAEPLAVSAASIYAFGELDEMVAASDLVVRGRVASTARGRIVGAGDNAVVSRLVTVEVGEVLAGTTQPATVLVEEEGWLADGTPIEVNGLRASRDGLDAIWFLDQVASGDVSTYLVINQQGRYDVEGSALRGAEGRDPFVDQLEGLGPERLAADVRRLAPPR